MKLLLIGNGGREHAIAHKLVQSPRLTRLFVAPGNGGTEELPKTENVPIAADALDDLVAFAQANAIDLTIVGPEAPLVAGVVDRFQAAGLKIFGPTQAAAQIEGSKAFSKAFMQRHAIPTGQAESFTDFDAAMRYLRQLDTAPVVKASGLAAGKGVIVPVERAVCGGGSARHVAGQPLWSSRRHCAHWRSASPAPKSLCWPSATAAPCAPCPQPRTTNGSWTATRAPIPAAWAPSPPRPCSRRSNWPPSKRSILLPTVQGLAAEGMPYVGVLYAGIMLTPDGPKVLEFNCRFGDPETQVLLPLLESDLLEVFLACVEARLEDVELSWRNGAAVTVVMVAQGYPETYASGVEITGIAAASALGCTVYLAGARRKEARLLTAGGRVLAVTGVGRMVETAAHKAYAGVAQIKFNEAQYRRDIGLTTPLPAPKQKRRRPAPSSSKVRPRRWSK